MIRRNSRIAALAALTILVLSASVMLVSGAPDAPGYGFWTKAELAAIDQKM